MTKEEINKFAATLKTFFDIFDACFLNDDRAEKFLKETKTSLQERISHNESALPVILAMGGRYNSEKDRAKVKEVDAIISLLQARKDLLNATIEEADTANENKELLKIMFGV